ncbi:hypothetical protein JCM8202_002664 [Rhodotorula sphaerocarpa]
MAMPDATQQPIEQPGGAASSDAVFPPLLKSDVLACQFSHWYPRFRRCAPKATVIRPLPEDEPLVDFLEADGLFLPEGSGPMGISELSDSEDDEAEDSDNDDEEAPPTFAFPRLDAEIRSALDKYEGAVFPKLNWSSPQDAAWMLPGQNMKCQTPADVYLLLKSSDFISHDLDHAFDDCVDHEPPPPPEQQTAGTEPEAATSPRADRLRPRARPYSELVLKKWFDMPKSQEWRCFVRENRLLGVSQRDTTLYDFLQPREAQIEIRDLVHDFWRTSIRDEAPLKNYVLDIYITRDRSRAFVIDFNPFSPRTDPLLFSYPDLYDLFLASSPAPGTAAGYEPRPQQQDDAERAFEPELRVVTPASDPASQSAVPRYAHNRYPKDVVDLSEGQSIAEFAKEWMTQVGEAAGLKDGGEAAETDGTGAAGSGGSAETERVGR